MFGGVAGSLARGGGGCQEVVPAASHDLRGLQLAGGGPCPAPNQLICHHTHTHTSSEHPQWRKIALLFSTAAGRVHACHLGVHRLCKQHAPDE